MAARVASSDWSLLQQRRSRLGSLQLLFWLELTQHVQGRFMRALQPLAGADVRVLAPHAPCSTPTRPREARLVELPELAMEFGILLRVVVVRADGRFGVFSCFLFLATKNMELLHL